MNQPFATETLVTGQSLQEGLKPRPDAIDNALHRQIVDRVCAMYAACKRDQSSQPAPYLPAGEWVDYLEERRACYDRFKSPDAAEDLLRNFWRNELGPIVKEYAMFEQVRDGVEPNCTRFQKNVSRNFLIWSEIFGQPASVLDIPAVGNPWGYMIRGQLVAPKATRFHALASQAAEIVRGVDKPIVLEIGGGYAGFPYYLLRDRPGCTYIDLDLPETLVIAAYYLLCTLPDRNILLYGEADHSQMARGQYDAVLLPNFAMPKIADDAADLVINTFSLSEVGPEPLEEYLKQIGRICRGKFLHNNMDRTGVVNRGFARIPASKYPVDSKRFRLLNKGFDLFHGHDGDYRVFLYERIHSQAC